MDSWNKCGPMMFYGVVSRFSGVAMFANMKNAFLAGALIAISMPMTSMAADMIQYSHQRAAPKDTYYRTYAAQETCSRNVVSYRAPYERHSELVTLCHPPLNWHLSPSSATSWAP